MPRDGAGVLRLGPDLPPAARLAALPLEQRRAILDGLSAAEAEALLFHWPLWARPSQLPPEGSWRTWLMLGGRGSGKTRSAAEFIRTAVETGRHRHIGLIGQSDDAVRSVMVEGPSGILAVCPLSNRPKFEPSLGRLTWPNGSTAYCFSAERPAALRGPNLSLAWCDELAAWTDPDKAWALLEMAVRVPGPLGDPPRLVISTTPAPSLAKVFNCPYRASALRAIPGLVVTASTTYDNASNLDRFALAALQRRYGGTSLGRQELLAEILADTEGALWRRADIDKARLPAEPKPEDLIRLVVAIDPSGGSGTNNAEVGIVVAGKDKQGHAYVLQDASARLSPERWAARAIDLYEAYRADRIVCEQNFGGAMVEATIRMVAQSTNRPCPHVTLVNASRGKQIRAQPVVALYEQHRVHHLGVFAELEDQMCQWEEGQPSPDRLDALVWAISELLVSTANLDIARWISFANNSRELRARMYGLTGRMQ
jgi:phage terminase large subunit-like protein